MPQRKCCETPKGSGPHLTDCQHANHQSSSDTPDAFEKNYRKACMICGEKPTVGTTELCGPHCFGEADTMNGNW